MSRHVALLRGINVGGRNRLSMPDLISIFEALGHREVRTVLQSGNVIFDSTEQAGPTAADAISARVFERHGFRPPVLIVSEDALRAAIDRNPFPTDDGKAVHVVFLESAPRSPDLGAMEKTKKPSERFRLVKNVLYLFTPDGFARSKLANSFERCLGVAATARNWNTVTKIRNLLDRT